MNPVKHRFSDIVWIDLHAKLTLLLTFKKIVSMMSQRDVVWDTPDCRSYCWLHQNRSRCKWDFAGSGSESLLRFGQKSYKTRLWQL